MIQASKRRNRVKVFICLFGLISLLSAFAVNQPVWAQTTVIRDPILVTNGNDWSSFPTISADGRFLAFASNADNLIDGDTNQVADIFVYDANAGRTRRVSVSSEGAQSNAISTRPAISADGRFVAFESLADNLVEGDTNFLSDVFVHDRLTGVTERVSVNIHGAEGNGWSEQASLSRDGRFVAFVSSASNLFPGDTNEARDAFLYDRLTGYVQLVSLNSDGERADAETTHAVITPADRTVVFKSSAANLASGDYNEAADLFAYNRLLFRTIRIPDTEDAGSISTSTGGQWIGYLSPERAAQGTGNVHDQLNDYTSSPDFPEPLYHQVIAPNGDQVIAVGSAGGEFFNLYAHSFEDGETVLLAESVGNARPAVSVDGSITAYVKTRDSIPQLHMLDRRAAPEPTYTVSGRITGPWGDPLAQVTVKAGSDVETMTDSQGYFFLSGIPTGPLTIRPEKPGFVFHPAAHSLNAGADTADQDFNYAYVEVLEEARKDIGMPYDHRCDSGPECEGAFHGYAAGQCSDLVLDAFTWGADYNIKLALENDAKAHPEHYYQSRNARDAFDMWRYFMYSGQMLSNSAPYQIGDIAFFDWSGDGEVDHVALVSEVNSEGIPTWMVDASGVINSNPNGLAAELPWEPFHERSARGHARWTGAYESAVFGMPSPTRLQVGVGSTDADLRLADYDGLGVSGKENTLAGSTYFDFDWEQNLTLIDPLAGGENYFIVLSNPAEQEMPYYFVIQTMQDGRVSQATKIIDTLPPNRVHHFPLVLSMDGEALGFEIVTVSRQMSAELK